MDSILAWVHGLAVTVWAVLADSLGRESVLDNFKGGLLVLVVGGLATWLVPRLARGLGRFPSLLRGLLGLRRAEPLEVALGVYRDRLTAQTSAYHHAWMKEGQTLGEIMVPVSVEIGGAGGGIENLRAVLGQVFSAARGAAQADVDATAPRIALIGGPGSGKSVTLRLIARDGWGLPRPGLESSDRRGLVPVLLSFADLRDANLDLCLALVVSLRRYGLTLPPTANGIDPIAAWVTGALAEGRLLVLVDALDELELGARAHAARALNQAMHAWPRTPFVVTCRTAAWQDQIADHRRIRIDMAPFHSAAIRQFVRRWRFDAPKSAGELLAVINSQQHVAVLARNPLMLSIVCFLYAKSGRRLPNNRAQFYMACSRALLEEWDHTQNPMRANRFGRPHKERLLAALAFDHITGTDPDREIDEHAALALIATEMEDGLGLQRADNYKLLEELIQNAGLLVRQPPSGLRFPHQTFLEFFAAQHLLAAGDLDGTLGRYVGDPGRWRDVLLLYGGLCTQKAVVSRILDTLLGRSDLGVALTALTEAQVVDPAAASRVLDAAEAALKADVGPPVIASLGYLSANRLTTYGQRAAGLLHGLLRGEGAALPLILLQALVVAALRWPPAELAGFLIDNLERLEPGRILPVMPEEDALQVSAAILREAGIPLAKRCAWIDGLRRAHALPILFDLNAQTWPEPELGQAVAVALGRCSTLGDFWTLADRSLEMPDGGADDGLVDVIDLTRWGWPAMLPATGRGRLLCFRLARHLSWEISRQSMEGVHPRLQILACDLAMERERKPG